MGSATRACASRLSRSCEAASTSLRSIRRPARPSKLSPPPPPPPHHLRPPQRSDLLSSVRRVGCLSGSLPSNPLLTTSPFPSHLSTWMPCQVLLTDDEDGT